MKITTIFIIFTLIVSSTSFAKRLSPKPVPSIVSGDYEYTVPHVYKLDLHGDSPIRGGVILVRDVKTKEPLWAFQVYETKYDLELEKDVQDVFITKMEIIEINGLGNVLTVTDELERTYEVDPDSGKVFKID